MANQAGGGGSTPTPRPPTTSSGGAGPSGHPTPTPAPTRPTSTPTGSSGYTRSQFAHDLLVLLGYPTSTSNIDALLAWMAAEGGSAAFNPLNTTQGAAGSSDYNSVGVKNYTSYQQGLQATALTLRNGRYGNVLSALQRGNDPYAVGQAVAASPWGTGEGVLRVLNAGGATDAKLSGAGGPSTGTTVSGLDSTYGYASAFFNSAPDLRDLIRQAVAQNWNQQQFDAHLQNTQWYQTHSQASRSWIALSTGDPATAQAQITTQSKDIQAQAFSLGVFLDPARRQALATDSLKFGWDAAQLRAAIAAEYHYNAAKTGAGEAGTDVQAFKQLASDYGVPISDTSIAAWTRSELATGAGPDAFKGYVTDQAKSLYPTLAKAIDSGVTVRQYADPYAQIAAQELGINPSDFNLADPKWQRALLSLDPQTKQRTPLTLDDWRSLIRTNPTYGFDASSNGRQQAAQLATQLGQQFGAIG